MMIAKPADPVQVTADHTYIKRSHDMGENDATSAISTKSPKLLSPGSGRALSTPTTPATPSSVVHSDDDRSWHPSMASDRPESLDSDFDDSDNSGTLSNTLKRCIVHISKLEELLLKTNCSFCQSPVNRLIPTCIGASVEYIIEYVCDHPNFNWSSSEYVGAGRSRVPAVNIEVCAATLYAGLTHSSVKRHYDLLELPMVSQKRFYEIQNQILIPIVSEAWLHERDTTVTELKDAGVPLCLAGDGRYDSPGYNAKYMTYSFIDSDSNKIVDFELVQVNQTGTSQAMEKFGFSMTLDRLLEEDVPVATIATDRHTGIRAIMRKEYTPNKNINHQFDVFHMVNSVRKKLQEASKKKANERLGEWMKSIINQIWYASKNCGGDPERLEELITSMCYHIAGVHKWKGYKHYNACLHNRLSAQQQKKTKWLKRGVLQALKDIILDRKLLADLRHLSLFCHTGSLETYHSKMLTFCPKRIEFDYPCMLARTQLAALDHNENVGRPQATVGKVFKGTGDLGEKRFRMEWKKRTKSWVSWVAYQPTSHSRIDSLMVRALEVKQQDNLQSLPAIRKSAFKNIAKIPAPVKAEAIEKHVSRFK